MDLTEQFENFIRRKNLFSRKDTILLAVSGGLDSVVMTELFARGRYKISLAHCNFKLRGEESEGEEEFVRKLAKEKNCPFFSVAFETRKLAREKKLSIQEVARDLRYAWFRNTAAENKYTRIATAHHLNDSIETFFINLIRGTGISGLAGILPVADDALTVRPLLFATRNELEEFATAEKLRYRTDSSNETDDYLRNRIRHHLTPAFKKLQPDFEKVMKRNLDNLLFARSIFEDAVSKKMAESWLSLPGTKLLRKTLEREKFPAELFCDFVRRLGFNSRQAKDIWESKRTGSREFSENYILTNDRDGIILSQQLKGDVSPGSITRPMRSLTYHNWKLRIKTIKGNSFRLVDPGPMTYSLALDKLAFPLQVRLWQPGDSFRPLGMKGKKKVGDFLTDRKVSRPDKEKTCVLLSGKEIVCVLGHRIDDRYKVTNETKEIYQVQLIHE